MLSEAQLVSFCILSEEAHFGRAARRLYITQPALTRRLQQLEADLGVRLLDREARRVRLTPAGTAFVAEAEALLKAMAAARRTAQAAAGTIAGRIAIGFDGAATYALIPRLIAEAARLLPQVEIEFAEMGSLDQLREVQFRRLDIGLVRPLAHAPEVVTECVFAEPLVLAVPAGHRLAKRRRPTLADLDGEPLVAYSEAGRYLRDLIGAELDRAGAEPAIVQRMSRTHSILALVSTGLGLAIVPASARNAAFDNISFKPLPIAARAEWHAATHRGAAAMPVGAMLDLLRALRRR